MNKEIKFSVVITSYNYGQYVERAVRSALQQSLAPFQIVVVDDGSDDGSQELLRMLYGENKSVELSLSEKNKGQLASFIRGVQKCTGDVICFLDADDHWDSNYLDLLGQHYTKSPEVGFIYTNLKFDGAKSGVWFDSDTDTHQGFTMLLTYHTNEWIGAPTSAISMRTGLCRQVLAIPESFYDDWKVCADDCLVFGASLMWARKLYLGQARVNYCVHEANNWFLKPQDEGAEFRRQWVKRRLFRYWADSGKAYGGDTQFTPMASMIELKSRPRPAWAETKFYIGMAWQTRGHGWPMRMRLRQVIGMLWHYLRSRVASTNSLLKSTTRNVGR